MNGFYKSLHQNSTLQNVQLKKHRELRTTADSVRFHTQSLDVKCQPTTAYALADTVEHQVAPADHVTW